MPEYSRSKLSIRRILQWADAHHRRTGRWPSVLSGEVPGEPDETWRRINQALALGYRGMRGGDSLSRLLARHRGSNAADRAPRITLKQILQWADDHQRRTGRWPKVESGPIRGAPGENWKRVDNALRWGLRGLPPGSSLPMLLEQRRRVRNRKGAPPLFTRDILAWADAHHRRTGAWPTTDSGPVEDAPGEVWSGINAALFQGSRGLPGGLSLARFLAHYRGVRNRKGLPRLAVAQILRWADAHIRRTGRRPTNNSGPIPECPGETWCSVNRALQRGRRGFRGKSSLAQFLDRHGRMNEPASPARA
jgi:hypothetical protein